MIHTSTQVTTGLPTLALDTETDLIKRGCLAPPLVCVSTSDHPARAELYHVADAKARVADILTRAAEGRLILVGQNIAYDMAVFLAQWPDLTPLIFGAYDAGAIRDTMIQEMLLDLAKGQLQGKYDSEGDYVRTGYSLDAISQRRLSRALDKGADGWRLRYIELLHVPLRDWPERAVTYAKDDARTTLEIHLLQLAEAALLDSQLPDVLQDSPAQARSAFALHLVACYGLRTDPEAIASLEARIRAELNQYEAALAFAGLLNAKGSRNMKAIKDRVVASFPAGAPTTEKGQVSTSAETLLQCTDPDLHAVVKFAKAQKALGTYVEKLKWGVDFPIQPRINSLLETGRTSMTSPMPPVLGFNAQNIPTIAGFRECFVPRPGFIYGDVDYDVAELRSLGQVMVNLFGIDRAPLAQTFRRNPKADPHVELAAHKMKITEAEAYALKKAKDKAIKQPRQDAKAANFGFPGGMGVARFIATERKKWIVTEGQQGGIYDVPTATQLKYDWTAKWGMDAYFTWVADRTGWGSGTFQQFVSGRYRGGCGFCDGANTLFQGMTADGAKRAVYEVVKRMYAVPASALFGSRLVNFIHDELLAEMPEDGAHEASHEMAAVMIEAMQYFTPDVPCTASPALARRWYKGMEPVYNAQGRLVPWEPEQRKAA